MNGKSHDDQCCPPSRAQYPCRASRPAIAAQAPACPALPRPHIRARQVPITQFGIQQMIIGLALAAARNGGSVRVLRGFREHSACCSPPTPMAVYPAFTALWPQDRSSGLHGPALPDMDFGNRASSNVLSNFVSESGSTDFVNNLVRLQAEAAGDDFFLDLGGAAEDRNDLAESWPRERFLCAITSRHNCYSAGQTASA